jgi:hypothetical protein
MAKSMLLEKFMHETEDELLRMLIQTYTNSLDLSEDERVELLVAKLKEIFEERNNASCTT